MKINALHKIADVSEVRRFYDTVEIHCRGLQSLGVDPKTYGIWNSSCEFIVAKVT